MEAGDVVDVVGSGDDGGFAEEVGFEEGGFGGPGFVGGGGVGVVDGEEGVGFGCERGGEPPCHWYS